ncbi:exodeoxyribonuclease V subunit beta [Methylotenera sp.]|uniref:UvrD-helicase domain-containing protein n=1 Tax=Methylotenera sp. TaxID=2051956 RepID=UPI0024875E72|nr:UvrD-helicase domain-containing protein [Methylotenera sp.]MDI1299716.1 UvrD-helicase domain-containing protein [Methylotenera sp.]
MDTLNRVRALELASFVVEAPAGAGKTELLTQRYLKLLATVNEPEEIIALTFTNKAAAEMRNRILLSLENAQNQTIETAAHKLRTRELANAALTQSKSKAWDIINQPSRLRILTIDALCSSLTRQMPLLSKFGGQPAVSDDTDSHYIEASRRAIAHIVHETELDDTVTIALSYLDNNSEKLAELLAKMLARRDQWLPHAVDLHTKDIEEVSQNTAVALQHLIAESLQDVLDTLTARAQSLLMPLARYAAGNLEADADIAPLREWQQPLIAEAECLSEWQALANFLVTKTERTFRKSLNKNIGFPATDEGKTYKEAYFEIVNGLENSQVIASVLDLPALANIAENQAIIKALTRLLILAERHLWIVFQAAGEVDFVAIAQSAQLALENEQGATDLALKLDYKISHLLIDEFQDTSPVQTRLIEKLIEGWQPDDGRTLFCVGDPMQSIYRFRKADVSLFLQASEFGIGHLPLTRLQLSRNNRSHPAVVDWINHAFKQVFPADDNINQGAISYRKFTATRPEVTGEGVTLHPLILEYAEEASAKADLKQIEASYVADLIVKLRAENGDSNTIAVLVRSRSHLKELVSEIRRNHPSLKFQAVEIEHLNERQTVQDALSLVCALHHRADRTHWLNLLRAPWCGLTLADLHALAGDNHRATIWQLMQDKARLSRLSDDGQLRLAHVNTVLTAAFNGQGRMPLRRWLESTWLQLGGGKCLVDTGDNRDVQVFFDLVEKTGRSGHLDIAALELGMKKLYAKPDIEADGSVQFLTIHKSKGLEFDAVILPALNRQPRHSDNELVLWQEVMVENHLHLIVAPLKSKAVAKNNTGADVYDFLKNLEKTRAENELVRLLYVAATRAHRQLHLIASMQANKEGEVKPTANSLLQALWPAVEVDFTQAVPFNQSASTSSTLDITQFKPQLQRLPSEYFVSVSNVMEKPNLRISEQADSLEDFTSDSARVMDFQKHCGTLAHLYMELFAKTDLQTWTSQRLQQCQPAMQKWLVQQGHTKQLAEQGAAQVLTDLQNTLASEAGQWVLQNHFDAVSELSLLQTEEAGVKNHVIDRTFVEGGVRWIVDYKLTALDEEKNTLDELSLLAEQHRPQLERYAGLFTSEGLAVKKAVLFLSVGKLVEL